jgi:hypothetical protein
MSTAVTGDLYIYGPAGWGNELRPQVRALYPGVSCSECIGDNGRVFFGLFGVPYPVEQVRESLTSLYRASCQQGQIVYWVWIPPLGADPLMGGTFSFRCRQRESAAVLAEVQRLYPGRYVYTYTLEDGGMVYEVDAPYPDDAMHEYLMRFMSVVPASWSWRTWFDRVMLPDGNIVSAGIL